MPSQEELDALKAMAAGYGDDKRQEIADKYKGSFLARLGTGFGDAINNAYGGRANASGALEARLARNKATALQGFDQEKRQKVNDYLTAKKENREDIKMADAKETRLQERADNQIFQKDLLDTRLDATAKQNSLNRAEQRANRAQAARFKAEERAEKKAEKLDQKKRDLYVPGIGYALTKTDAKELKDAKDSKESLDKKIGEMISLREKYGAERWNQEAVRRGMQLSKDVLLQYKNLAKLGVLSKSDEDIVNAIIPENPLAWEAASFKGQDTILPRLKKFQQGLGEDFNNTINNRIGEREAPKPKPGQITEKDVDNMSLEQLKSAGLL